MQRRCAAGTLGVIRARGLRVFGSCSKLATYGLVESDAQRANSPYQWYKKRKETKSFMTSYIHRETHFGLAALVFFHGKSRSDASAVISFFFFSVAPRDARSKVSVPQLSQVGRWLFGMLQGRWTLKLGRLPRSGVGATARPSGSSTDVRGFKSHPLRSSLLLFLEVAGELGPFGEGRNFWSAASFFFLEN